MGKNGGHDAEDQATKIYNPKIGIRMKETLQLPQLTILREFPGFGSAKK